jgi:hypothetical protein
MDFLEEETTNIHKKYQTYIAKLINKKPLLTTTKKQQTTRTLNLE